MDALADVLSNFAPITLDDLDERAALLRRVDNKYALPFDDFARLAGQLREDHEVLEIDGKRSFGYSSTYFETQALRCFTDHVQDRVPRFKARTRLYEDSEKCVFEVKLKRSEDETDKRQIDYDPADRSRLTDAACACLADALRDAGVEAPDDLAAALTTAFDRTTFAARSGSERLTCDFGVRMTAPGGEDSVRMRGDLVLIETKSEHGRSPADERLAGLGFDPISLSKYRVGMSLVGGARRFGAHPGGELFS